VKIGKKRKSKVFHQNEFSTTPCEFFTSNSGKLVQNLYEPLILQGFSKKVFLKLTILKCGKLF